LAKFGFLTTPFLYLHFLKELLAQANNLPLIHMILMDSDTFWAVDDIKRKWNKYACARGEKNIVLSAEISCWVEKYCSYEDIQRWYRNLASTPSYSPFANSGIVMGHIVSFHRMLEYIVIHNESYQLMSHKRRKFDDQYVSHDTTVSVACVYDTKCTIHLVS
jgi:hypothetical protein